MLSRLPQSGCEGPHTQRARLVTTQLAGVYEGLSLGKVTASERAETYPGFAFAKPPSPTRGEGGASPVAKMPQAVWIHGPRNPGFRLLKGAAILPPSATSPP